MKKGVKISCSIALFILIGGSLWIINAFIGNPISKIIANNTAQKYISQNYSNQNLQVSEISYNFKTGDYTAKIKSPTCKDTHFLVSISPLGKIEEDSYKDDVLGKHNTYTRINDLYFSKVKSILEKKDISYKGDIYFGEIKEIDSIEVNANNEEITPIYGVKLSKLKLDKNYDINELGKKYGHIVFYAEDKNVSVKRASEILLDLKDILGENNISFYAIDFTLEKPHINGKSNDDKYIGISEFLYSDIYESGLEERIQKANDKLHKYYEEQNKIKANEIEGEK